MKRLLLAASAAALLASMPAWAQNTPRPGGPVPNPGPNPPSAIQPMPDQATGQTQGGNRANQSERSADTRFIDHVARDGVAEVELGRLAEQKSSNADVKAFAQRLVRDHSQANQQLQQIAQRDNVQVPTDAGRHSDEEMAKLKKLNGTAFDREFVQLQVRDHEKDVQYFQREASQLQDPQLRSFAQQTEPVLQQHLQMAQQLASRPGMASSGSSQQQHSAGGQQQQGGRTNQ